MSLAGTPLSDHVGLGITGLTGTELVDQQVAADCERALERHGVDTTSWWDRQLGLCTVGMMATMAWEKAVGDADELAWWEAAALDGTQYL